MLRVQAFVRVIVFATLLGAGHAAAQTGSFWQGVIDANIPFEFYAERFNAQGIEGRVRFGQARYGFADINRLCDAARLTATREGDHYAYRITGACGGKGTLWMVAGEPDRIKGRGRIYDAASASAFKRRYFHMTRK